MFAAVGSAYGLQITLHRVAHSGDVRAIRTVFGRAGPVSRATPVFYFFGLIFGLIFGLVAVPAGGFDFLAPWLIASYVLFAVGLVAGGAIAGPWIGRVARAAAKSPDDGPSPELKRLIHDRTPFIADFIGIAVLVPIIYLMVAKPGSLLKKAPKPN
jgi:uncharacterized membrane protein